MTNTASLRALGLFDKRVPRYTSYPPATVFTNATGASFQSECLQALDPAEPISVYIHIPFCERLCWFCACQTQGTKTLGPVESYLDAIKDELSLLRRSMPAGIRMGRLHWGGGTPTILPPAMIHTLAQAIKAAIPPDEAFEFSVEIDPTMVDEPKIAALAAEGMTRASIGIQDFAPEVQDAIGRHQSFDQTRDCVQALRSFGITSLNADLVYGLPHQTPERIAASIDKVLMLDPDRIALFGYAHVPHMSKRQKLIDEAALPGDVERHALAGLAAGKFRAAGLTSIGIDHFAKPDDTLARAAANGKLRRNFQGYTDDTCSTLVGIGASSISRFRQGYVQNAAATGAYMQRTASGILAGYRGHHLSPEDALRARAIEMLMCDFQIHLDVLTSEFGALADCLQDDHKRIAAEYGDMVKNCPTSVTIQPDGKALARIIANAYDRYDCIGASYSKAS